MKKKLALALTAAMMLTVALTGCGAKEEPAPAPAPAPDAPATSEPAPAPAEKLDIVLATGSVMVLENCFLPEGVPGWNLRNLLITALLVAAMPCWKAVTKKKLSSIGLILLSAVLGILVYGI